MSMRWFLCVTFLFAATSVAGEGNGRKPADDAQLKSWLENTLWHHHFTDAEAMDALGLSADELAAAKKKFDISDATRPKLAPKEGEPLRVLPYPGGRHPRIGFLDGAVDPQRESKVSVFTPWDEKSYVVVDVPEAIWSNLGLTYLAHTHVPTIFSKQKIEMEKLEWKWVNVKDGEVEAQALSLMRKLPNGISFTSVVKPGKDAVRMEMTLTNGTKETLSDLRVQMCVMLKGAEGFTKQTNDNKVISKPYVAAKDEKGERWIISAWEPSHRPWANAPVPCLHSDPKFPDAKPGETVSIRGWLSFYEGKDVEGEFKRIEATGWSKDAAKAK